MTTSLCPLLSMPTRRDNRWQCGTKTLATSVKMKPKPSLASAPVLTLLNSY